MLGLLTFSGLAYSDVLCSSRYLACEWFQYSTSLQNSVVKFITGQGIETKYHFCSIDMSPSTEGDSTEAAVEMRTCCVFL